MADPILDLATLIERPTIDIDGTRYEILSPDELSVLDNRRFGLWSEQLEKLQQGDALNPEIEALVETIARKVLVGVPPEVFAKLQGTHLMAVVQVFTGLLLRNRLRVAGATQKAMAAGMTGAAAGGTIEALANQLIGASFSPGSSASTAAPRATGWRARLSQLFARIWS